MLKKLLGSITIVAAFIAGSSTAEAALIVNVYDNNTLVATCTDNAACDTNASVGTLDLAPFSTTNWTVDDLTAVSTAADASTPALLELTSFETRVSTGDNVDALLRIETSDTGFSNPLISNTLMSELEAEWENGTGTNSITFQSYGDDGNALFGKTTAAPEIELTANGNSSGSATTSVAFSATAPYSLTNITEVDLRKSSGGAVRMTNTTGNTSVTGPTADLPEPSSLLLLATSGFAVAARLRRRRK